MALVRSLLQILELTMKTPEAYGWFHLLCLGITFAVTLILCTRYRHSSKETIRKVILGVAVATILLEGYKQIVFTYELVRGHIVADYQWYAFPMQFCSTPMYAGLLTAIFRKGKIHDALCAYLASYSIFAGCCVMFYPAQVFIETIGVNIQTMFWHGGMIVVGVWLLATGYVKVDRKTILKAMCVFLFFVLLAMFMNELAYMTGLTKEHSFNMFYISPYMESTLPVYGVLHKVLPYPVSLAIYIGAFTIAADLILQIGYFFQNHKYHVLRKMTVMR